MSWRALLVAAALWFLGIAPSMVAAQPRAAPRALVSRALEAMGGEQAVRGINSTVLEFNQAAFGLGQEETPESPPRAGLLYGRITNDYQGNRREVRQEQRPPNGPATRQRSVIVGNAGMIENAEGNRTPAAP
ncbi:MAG TPA: hypothetical protein VJ596_06980, partial [Gemmatimonadaceae bacterium]|nr:hypothetical protein [Gemmatimonadaceae bacterium]